MVLPECGGANEARNPQSPRVTSPPVTLGVVLFDLDGTLWESPLRIDEVRRELGLPADGRSLLEQIGSLAPGARARALAALQAHEQRALACGHLKPGTHELLHFLRVQGIRTVLVTNNSRQTAAEVLARTALQFDLVRTRDDGPAKPDPRAFLEPLELLGVKTREAAVVGDSHLDLRAAWAAGIAHVVLVAPQAWMRAHFPGEARFYEVATLEEARRVLAALLNSRA